MRWIGEFVYDEDFTVTYESTLNAILVATFASPRSMREGLARAHAYTALLRVYEIIAHSCSGSITTSKLSP